MGTRKLHHVLAPEFARHSIKIGRDKLFELLKQHSMLVPLRRSRGPRTTDGARTWWKNILDQATIEAPNQGRVADISYLHTLGGFCYMALSHLPAGATPIHHSDRGSQYRSKSYTQRLREAGCAISMPEEDHCAENAQAERVNGILKGEYYLDMVFRDTRQAKKAVKTAIKLYNE